jgi:hypothetical protein
MKRVILPLFLILIMVGCAGSGSIRKDTGIGLLSIRNVFVNIAIKADELCVSGVISREDCVIINDAYLRGDLALAQAKVIWDHMVLIDSFHSNQDYDNLLIEMLKLTITIENIVRKYTGE